MNQKSISDVRVLRRLWELYIISSTKISWDEKKGAQLFLAG